MDMVKKQSFCQIFQSSQSSASKSSGSKGGSSLTVRKPGDIVVNLWQAETLNHHTELSVVAMLQMESLEDELERILMSSLSAEQSGRLEALHCHIARLLAKSNADERTKQAIEQTFTAIDRIMQTGFERLTTQQRLRVETIEQQIDRLFYKTDPSQALAARVLWS